MPRETGRRLTGKKFAGAEKNRFARGTYRLALKTWMACVVLLECVGIEAQCA